MKQLYDKKYWWVGHYNERFTPRFMEYTEEYIESLIQYRPEYYWYYQENADAKMVCNAGMPCRFLHLPQTGITFTKRVYIGRIRYWLMVPGPDILTF